MIAHRAALALLAGQIAFFALIQVFSLWSGALGVNLSHRFAVLCAFAAVALAWLFATKVWDEHAAALPPLGGASERPSRFSRWVAGIIGIPALLWMGVTWLRLWHLAYLRPTYDWDGLYYHIPAMHAWARAGHIAWIDTIPDVLYVNFPMGIEAHTFFTHQLLETSRILNAGNLWYWPLALCAVAVLAMQMGARGLWPWLAGALWIGAPTVIGQSATNYIDVAFASLVMAAVAASCALVGSRRAGWWMTLLWGAAVGLVLGGKGTGVPFALILVAAVAVAALIEHGAQTWRIWLPRLAVAGIVVLAVGGYWAGRGAVKAGNPIYPIELRIGALVVAEGIDYVVPAGSMPGWLEQYPALLRAPIAWLQTDAPIYGYDTIGGMGYIWVAAAVPAILLLGILVAAGRVRSAAPVFLLAAALIVLLLFIQPAIWWARYTLWLYILGLPALAIVLQRGTSARRAPLLQLLAALALLATAAVATWESHRTLEWQLREGRVESAEGSPDRYLTSREMFFPGIDEAPGFREWLAADRCGRSRSMVNVTALMVGTISLPLGQREIWVLPDEPSAAEIRLLQENGVRWVFWDASEMPAVPDALRDLAVEDHIYTLGDEAVYHALRLPDLTESD